MESKAFQLLEFHKVLEILSGYTTSEPGAHACRSISVCDDIERIQHANLLYNQAVVWVAESDFKLGSFISLDGLFNYLASEKAVLDQDALFALKTILEKTATLRNSLDKYEERGWNVLGETVFRFDWPQKSASGINRCLDQEGRLKDDSSPDLYAVREEIRGIHQRCTKRVKDYVLKEGIANYLQEDFMTISSDRYVLPLKVNFKNRLNGIIHDYSQTGETCYFEPMFLVETNNRLQELKKEEREEEYKVLVYLTDLIRQELGAVEACYNCLVEMDVLLAKIRLAGEYDGRAVDVIEGVNPLLRGARHPLLALQEEKVQSIDVELLPEHHALIVSGGNAGGKTVCLKTLGLTAIMVYAGLPVPVEPGCRLPLWKNIFVIMGDEQSLEENVSTFTAQIHYLKNTWNEVNANTLYILDEFGAGTDPTQGAALAQGVIDELMAKKATVIAATHFPALKAYAVGTKGVRAASVLFEPSTKKPLYKLAYDQVGASIALDVARDNGLPEAILQRAEKYLLLDGSDTSATLDRLNALAVEREKEVRLAKKERDALQKKQDGLEAKFQKERQKLLDDIQAKAQGIVKQWKADKISRKQAQKEMAGLREKLADKGVKKPASVAKAFGWDDIQPGMQVRYEAWDKVGIVLECNDRKEQAKVDINGVAMWVKAEHLGPAQGNPATVKPGKAIYNDPAEHTGLTLNTDLRGYRADEALSQLERFLDDALMRGASTLEIVHGRGTGALRREIHDFLKTYPAVKTFALANEERGGDGMTEVTLK
ncbi:endonuclease MutS2 [Salidesulfovibrio onnuriiensis]|uniref:endonuclease MutS2 n=1 Tax=Salidesulfovibrio onnuriiensis TaxID=2583823 RepID=UPI0011C8AAE9|nr:Smr/MutS family protein [Salidesulfovibrio onnuriiensis]